MMSHNICFHGKIGIVISELSLVPFLSGALAVALPPALRVGFTVAAESALAKCLSVTLKFLCAG